MKRTGTIVAGVLVLGLGVYGSTRLWAQPPAAGAAGTTGAPAAAPVTMRLRLVNLQYVIKNYKRTEALRAEHMGLFKKYDDEIKSLKQVMDARTAQLQDPKYDAAQKEQIEKEIKRLQREMGDKSEEARGALGKKEGELITLIYKEVDESVRKYAQQEGIELVVHYNDAVADGDRNNPANIARKMSAGACMPMYIAPGLDISQDVVSVLNARYPGNAAAAGGSPAAAAGQPSGGRE